MSKTYREQLLDMEVRFCDTCFYSFKHYGCSLKQRERSVRDNHCLRGEVDGVGVEFKMNFVRIKGRGGGKFGRGECEKGDFMRAINAAKKIKHNPETVDGSSEGW